MAKTAGQIAYEAELKVKPTYHDGAPRRPWSQLSEPVRATWEKNPTTRWLGAGGGPTITDPNRPYCKPDQSCCDFCCGN